MAFLQIMKSIAKHLLTVSAVVLSGIEAHATLIDFEGLSSTANDGSTIPVSARLSTQLLESYGVSFTSTDPYVAVVNLGIGHATSGVNGIGGSRDNKLAYYRTDPVTISFFNPLNTSQMATTDSVSVRADLWGSLEPISLVAYDHLGAQLASVTVTDFTGPLLSISTPGIQKVTYFPTSCCGGAALDDLTFGPLTPVASPVPGPLSVLGVVTAYCHSKQLRQRISERDKIR
jgi:hypothetical protein